MLGVFAVCAALMFARKLPALIAVPVMALAIAALAGASFTQLEAVLVAGTVRLAPVMAYVIFGALLSRVTMATGIAETIIAYAAEFGGDRPLVVALVLSAAVAALFTSLYGLGAIIMVGSIVLPIMLTIGIPRRTAATLFMLAFALGFIFNVSQWGFYMKTFGVERVQMQSYALVLAAIDLLALVAFVFVRFRATRGYATWALEADEPPARKRVPLFALITPVLPIVLYFALGFDPVLAFVLAALYGVLTTRPRQAVPVFVGAAIRGVEDVAPAILLFMGIGMLLVATALPSVQAALAPLVTAIAPRNALAYVVLFGLLSPLALYRGPLNPFGVGIAVYTVLAGLGILPPVLLVAAVMAVVQVQNVCDPTNTQNVWVANFTGVTVAEITRITLPFQVAVATVAAIAAVTFAPALFGIAGPPVVATLPSATLRQDPATISPASLPLVRSDGARPFNEDAHLNDVANDVAYVAAGDETYGPDPASPAGMFAPRAAAFTIAVAPARANAAGAASVVFRQLQGWRGYHALSLEARPAASDCSGKAYAAALVVSVEPFGDTLVAGNDVGLALEDCAGWPVDEWHDTCDASRGADVCAERIESAALSDLFRLRTWIFSNRQYAQWLFDTGLAYRPGSGPTYFYSLFKTSDGQMRAFVRPGGPAYAAGLRTNDIVNKLDGKFWWEYGTYQTQQRAYDGMPHTFDVTRGPAQLSVSLGAPYAGVAAKPESY